ncbi:MAG TPA: M20/M25/M40 family metallo-hydrolase [Chloroflexota bacterium]|jgi:acetylornithine deacetylase/succinyl-diaminopimelate desuccinylase-like protein
MNTDVLASVDAARDEIVELLQQLVRVPTVNTGPRPDTGNETLACDLLRTKLEPLGIAYEVHESSPGRGNLIARMGRGGGKRLLCMSHTDVVPVEDESLWEHPPFSGTIDRGRVYGRGADDDKADVVAHCMAMVLLRRAGIELSGELVWLAAADEESGGRWGAGWVAEHFADAVRADVAVNEGSGIPVRSQSGLVYAVALGEKGRLEARVTRRGRSGHASVPWRADNPVPVLAEAIQRIAAYEPEIDVSHPYFRAVLSGLGLSQVPTAENIDRIADGLQDQALAAYLKAASRMTVTPTMLQAGVKSNSIPDRATLVCDVRALPGQDDAFVKGELEHTLEGLDVNVEVDYTAVSNASPPDSPFLDTIRAALGHALGTSDFRVIPSLTVGFTDSRFLRPLGTQVYGFAPHHPEAERNRTGVHGNNEFMEIDSLLLRTKWALALAIETLGVA